MIRPTEIFNKNSFERKKLEKRKINIIENSKAYIVQLEIEVNDS